MVTGNKAILANMQRNGCLLSHRRCEVEERNTRCLEQQVDLLRHSKKKTDQSSTKLQANIRHSVTELQELKRKFEVTECKCAFPYRPFHNHVLYCPLLIHLACSFKTLAKITNRLLIFRRYNQGNDNQSQ